MCFKCNEWLIWDATMVAFLLHKSPARDPRINWKNRIEREQNTLNAFLVQLSAIPLSERFVKTKKRTKIMSSKACGMPCPLDGEAPLPPKLKKNKHTTMYQIRSEIFSKLKCLQSSLQWKRIRLYIDWGLYRLILSNCIDDFPCMWHQTILQQWRQLTHIKTLVKWCLA